MNVFVIEERLSIIGVYGFALYAFCCWMLNRNGRSLSEDCFILDIPLSTFGRVML